MQMKRTLDTAAVVLATLLLLGFAVLSVRGIIDPQTAAARFGAEVNDAAGVLLLLMRHWRPLAILITVTAALPVFDMTVLSLNGVTPPFVHPVALLLILLTAALLWRRAAANDNRSEEHT